MRLLFAHDHRFQRGPGGELFTLGSFPAAAWDRYLEHFDEVQVIAREGGEIEGPARLSRSDRDQVRFEFLPNLSRLRELLFRSPSIDERMAAAVANADAVVARLPSEIGLLAVEHAKRLRKPYAVEVVGCAWDVCRYHGALSARIYAPLAYARNRLAISHAPLALYVTSSWLQRRYPNRAEWVSASNVALEPISSAQRARRESRLAALERGAGPVIGTVASMQTRSKGIQTALSALSSLRRSGLDLEYRILGAGSVEPWRAMARKLGILDLVHFDGTRKSGEDVCTWLDDIDIHLQPSFQEGLPRATIEAMSRGAACIGSSCGGIPELLPSARIHRPGDVAGLAAIVRRIVENPAELIACSRADREKSEEFEFGALHARRRALYARLRAQAA